jgi:hypothetical protein
MTHRTARAGLLAGEVGRRFPEHDQDVLHGRFGHGRIKAGQAHHRIEAQRR